MKVLQINSVCGIGSTGRITSDIHTILVEQGHESIIAYGRDFLGKCNRVIKIGKKYDIYAHVALTRVYDKHGFGSKKATLEFIKEVKKIDPDIIHLHNIHGYYINVETLFEFLKKINKPIVWTLHDCWAFTGHCTYFDYVECDKWKTQCVDCPQKGSYPTSFLLDNSEENFKMKKSIFNGVKNLTIVTPSKWLAALLSESFLSEYPIVVINNGIDLNIFKPSSSNFRQKYNLQNKFIILGVASVWDKRKGLKYFLELSNRIKSNEIIVLVGLTDKQRKQLPNNVIGLTRTTNTEELAEIYSAADLFLNPTLEDNFPTTNLEALACGTPVITFATGGSPEIINKSCGLSIEKGNIDELIKGINQIQLIPFSQEECISRAQIFNKEHMFRNYTELYGCII